jgi:hypothetical protein
MVFYIQMDSRIGLYIFPPSSIVSPQKGAFMSTTGVGMCSPATHCGHEHTIKEPTLYDQFIQIAMKVSVVVLGLISLLACPDIFAPFFAIGSLIGIVTHWNSGPSDNHQNPGGFCTQGFLEAATGVKLPDIANVAANVALTFVHLQHHEEAYVPLIGLYVGTWVGKELAPHINWAYRQVKELCF